MSKLHWFWVKYKKRIIVIFSITIALSTLAIFVSQVIMEPSMPVNWRRRIENDTQRILDIYNRRNTNSN